MGSSNAAPTHWRSGLIVFGAPRKASGSRHVSLLCADAAPAILPRPGYNVFSVDQDIALGKEAAAEIRQQVDVVKDVKSLEKLVEQQQRDRRDGDSA